MASQHLDGEKASVAPYATLSDGQIRVIQLKPGLPGTALEADLHHVQLAVYTAETDESSSAPASAIETPVPDFEAISYCWGDLSSPQSLSIGTGGRLTITKSLYTALQSFRHTDRSRYLWADAICINQKDTAERSNQVAMMGEIYATASCVLVWLGPTLPGEIETLAFTALTAPIESQGDRPRAQLLQLLDEHVQRSHTCGCCNSSIGLQQPLLLADALAAVAKLLERPYFTRLWCVQEVALAQNIQVYCGTHHAPWQIFTDVARVPGQFQDDQEGRDGDLLSTLPRSDLRKVWARCSYLNQLRARIRLQKKGKDIFKPTALCKDLLMMSALECQDPLDRIFGVSNVLGLHQFDLLRPDYNLPVAELYRRVVEIFLIAPVNRSGGRSATILALVGTETSTLLDQPSWVPNLHCLSERSRAKYTFYQWTLSSRQHCSDIIDFDCRISLEDPTELSVKGVDFATVETILDDSVCPSKHVHRRTGAKCPINEGVALLKWYIRCRQFLETYASGRYDRTVLGVEDAIHETFSMNHAMQRAALHTSLYRATITEWLTSVTADEYECFEEVDILMRDLKPYITGCPVDRDRNLCIVRGRFGLRASWVPPQALPGDSICHFSGAPYPFILRMRDDGVARLIGDAFVEGVTEPDILNLDKARWEKLFAEYRAQDDDLRQWMGSSNRAVLRQHSFPALKREDSMRKEHCREIIECIKDMYHETDDALSWLRFR